VLRDERPLGARREPSTAAAAQARILHGGDHVVGAHGERAFERLVAVVATVGRHRPGFGFIPEPAQHGSQLCHVFDSVASGSVSGLFGFAGTSADGAGAAWSFVASVATFWSSGPLCESVTAVTSGAVIPRSRATRSPARVASPAGPCAAAASGSGRPAS